MTNTNFTQNLNAMNNNSNNNSMMNLNQLSGQTDTSTLETIEYYFNELDAPQELVETVALLLTNPFAGLFPNQIVNALEIALSIKRKHVNIAFLAPMQSGKTGTIYVLVNYILPALGLLKSDENVIFVTSMRDKDLYTQNENELQKPYHIKENGQWTQKSSKIYVRKIDVFFTPPNPGQLVRHGNIKLIIRDEDQYGCGEDGTFDVGFFQELRAALPTMPLLAISATPFDVLDASQKGYNVSIIEGVRPDGYFGISEMIAHNLVDDFDNFDPLYEYVDQGKTVINLSYDMHEYMTHLLSFDNGVGIIRVSKGETAGILKRVVKNSMGASVLPVIVGSNGHSDYSIADGINQVRNHVMNENRRVLLIVVNALTAGKDLKQLKSHVRFVIESRCKQVANVAQGLPGRICGYHGNRNIKVMANIEILKRYAEFEKDYEVFFDKNWQSRVFDSGANQMSSQVSIRKISGESTVRDILSVHDFSVHQLNTLGQGLTNLPAMSPETFTKLISLFSQFKYDSNTKGFRLNINNTSIRIYTSYNHLDNRVQKMWGKSVVNGQFDDTGLHSNDTSILISNLPINHPNNKLGFTGIRVIKGGNAYTKARVLDTFNKSMYN